MYFRSAAAREGEQKESPPRMQEMTSEMNALTIAEPVLFDVEDSRLAAPSEVREGADCDVAASGGTRRDS
ncbi:MAG: hypothetical protein QOK30_3547 [Nocardioidaceae bacterium]|nr:hypothetical protein [Nocardioidaceae bacterium]